MINFRSFFYILTTDREMLCSIPLSHFIYMFCRQPFYMPHPDSPSLVMSYTCTKLTWRLKFLYVPACKREPMIIEESNGYGDEDEDDLLDGDTVTDHRHNS